MKRQKKLILIEQWSDELGKWVKCVDDNQNEWVVSQESYDAFKFTGFLLVSDKVNKDLSEKLKGVPYQQRTPKQKIKTILDLLHIFTGREINSIFPTLADIEEDGE